MGEEQLENEERITELEVRASFQERTVADLDQVVREFTVRIEAMEREVKTLKQALLGLLGDGQEVPPHDEEPPGHAIAHDAHPRASTALAASSVRSICAALTSR